MAYLGPRNQDGPRNRDDLVYLVARFLYETNYRRVAQRLKEKEHLVFDLSAFEFMVENGNWDKAEEYLSKFAGSDDEELSLTGILYEIRKQKYLEELMRPNVDVAEHIFNNEAVVLDFLPNMGLQDDRYNIQARAKNLDSSSDHNIRAARANLMTKLKIIVQNTPCLHERYRFRHLQNSSLWQLIDKRYNLAMGSQIVGSQQSTSSPSPISPDLGRFDEETYFEQGSTSSTDEASSSSSIPEISVVKDPAQLQTLRLPVTALMNDQRVVRLTYLKSGTAIVALLSNGRNVIWKWPQNDLNPTGQAKSTVPAELKHPVMINECPDANSLLDNSCFSLSSGDHFLLSASKGGRVSMFSLTSYERLETSSKIKPTPPPATSLAFSHDDRLIAVGKYDSTIDIYSNSDSVEVITTLQGHTKMITGLAFSLNSLVSSAADAQIIVWSIDNWEKKVTTLLEVPCDRPVAAMSKTEVQFHKNESHLLVVHETQLAIYNVTTLRGTGLQWIVGKYEAPINDATFSFDSDLVFASFFDGSVCIFTAEDLQARCRIKATAFIPSFGSNGLYRCPIVLAAHPKVQHQIVVGLTDGQAYVLEPTDEPDSPKELGPPGWDEESSESQ